jgi:hypothetical protein
LPYIIAGGGGFSNSSQSLHKLETGLVIDELPFPTAQHGVAPESYDVMNSGFLRLTMDPEHLTIDYFSMSFDDPPVTSPGPRDSVSVRHRNTRTIA